MVTVVEKRPKNKPGVLLTQVSEAVRDQYPGLVLEHSLWPDDLFEDVFSHVGIDSREGVVQEVDVSVVVGSPGHRQVWLLTQFSIL